MRARSLAAAVLAVLLVAGALAPAGAAQAQVAPEFDAYVPQPTLSPGQPNELVVQVVNDADDAGDVARTAGSVEVRLSAEDTPLSVQSGTTLLGRMPDGRPAQVSFALDVPYDVPGGTYELTLVVSYTDGGARETTRVPVEVRIDDRPIFELAGVDTAVDVGESGTVSVTVENTGSEVARDATVTLESTSGQVALGGAQRASRYAGTLQPGETATLAFEASVAEGAARQSYALQATVSYSDAAGTPGQSRPLSLGLVPGPEQAFELTDVASTLQVGEEGRLSGTVVNTGEEPVEDVVLLLESDSPTVTPREFEVPIGDLAGGAGAPFSFAISVAEGAEPGPERFRFVVEYRSEDGERRQRETADARTRIAPAGDAFGVEGVAASVTRGQQGTLRLEVTNQRNETVRDASAKLFADDPLSVTDDEAYVGTLEPGESAVVTFSVTAAGGALPRAYPVEMDLQYRTPDGDTRLSETYTVPVSVERGDGGGVPLVAVLAGAALLVVAVLAGAGILYRR